MINWCKPVLINGVHRAFRLGGIINGCQMVVCPEDGVEALYIVNHSGSSSYLNGGRLETGPVFENEPEEIVTEFFQNIYADGHIGGRTAISRKEADSYVRLGPKRTGCLRVRVTQRDGHLYTNTENVL